MNPDTNRRQGAATAVSVTIEEMDKVIRRAFRAFHPRVETSRYGEIVYILTPDDEDPESVIRIQTTIFKGRQEARGEGEDSIRIVLMNTRTNRPIAEKQQRVHRTTNWKDNLRERIETALETFEELAEARTKHKQMRPVREEQRQFQQENPAEAKNLHDQQVEMLEAVQNQHSAFSDMLGQMRRYRDKLLSEKQMKWVSETYKRVTKP